MMLPQSPAPLQELRGQFETVEGLLEDLDHFREQWSAIDVGGALGVPGVAIESLVALAKALGPLRGQLAELRENIDRGAPPVETLGHAAESPENPVNRPRLAGDSTV